MDCYSCIGHHRPLNIEAEIVLQSPYNDMSLLEHVAVLGFGVTGVSVARYFLQLGVRVTVLDTRPNSGADSQGISIIWDCEHWPDLEVELAVVSPGLELDTCLVREAIHAGVQLVSDIDVFFGVVDQPVIGITGTNGKSTVTSLVGHILNQSGKRCAVGGNLGVAVLDLLSSSVDCYALELSSFQLERSQLHQYHAACMLNVTEDHIDKHLTMQAYIECKQRIFAQANHSIFNRDDLMTTPIHAAGQCSFGSMPPTTPAQWGICHHDGVRHFAKGDDRICPVQNFTLTGQHNEQNALAACALIDGLVSHAEMASGLATFNGLAHRYQVVMQNASITYINDSKATNLGAAMAALAGLERRDQVILIAGGDAKGVDLSPLSAELEGRVRCVVALGQDASLLQAVAQSVSIDSVVVADMLAAVKQAQRIGKSGDVVLLSPACASIDMYANYAARGDEFCRAIETLEERRECAGLGEGA